MELTDIRWAAVCNEGEERPGQVPGIFNYRKRHKITHPWIDFKAQVLRGRMNASPEKTGIGKILSRAVRKRVV